MERRETMMRESTVGDLVTVREACRLLHVHGNTLRRWSDKGLLNAYRIGMRGDRRFRREEIEDILHPNVGG